MKFVDEFRDGERARALGAAIAAAADTDRDYRLMEFCGGHTHAVFRYGVPDLLPANVELIHGPGCPVCVLPIGRLDMAIRLVSDHPEVILASYGDMLRVPGGGRRSLLQARYPRFISSRMRKTERPLICSRGRKYQIAAAGLRSPSRRAD